MSIAIKKAKSLSFKSQILGRLAYYLILLLYKSLRVSVIKHPAYKATQPYLFAFWHGKQLMPVWTFKQHQTRHAVLVSPSKDGDILTVWLNQLGYEVVRGSSRHHNISALALMLRKLKEGYSLGFGIDGPIGPIHKVKPGMTHMAQKLGVWVIPVGSAFSRKWVVKKAWDKYEIPKPFAKAILCLGEPFEIKVGDDLESWNLRLETLIHEIEAKANALARS